MCGYTVVLYSCDVCTTIPAWCRATLPCTRHWSFVSVRKYSKRECIQQTSHGLSIGVRFFVRTTAAFFRSSSVFFFRPFFRGFDVDFCACVCVRLQMPLSMQCLSEIWYWPIIAHIMHVAKQSVFDILPICFCAFFLAVICFCYFISPVCHATNSSYRLIERVAVDGKCIIAHFMFCIYFVVFDADVAILLLFRLVLMSDLYVLAPRTICT